MFVDVSSPDGAKHQVTSAWQETHSAEHARHQALKNVTLHSPISVTGTVIKVHEEGSHANTRSNAASAELKRVDLELVDFQVLNAFPKNIIISKGVQFPASKRHLQLRFSEALQYRLQFRDYINQKARNYLQRLRFREYETPLLFKSTPEGAREFLVPTRPRGYAYALPQSPQQFKQLLMASGLGRYFQFARCFRDEDHRADRQPEFTQLDLEMPFAAGIDVMQTVEEVLRSTYGDICRDWIIGSEDQGVRPRKQGLAVSDEWRELPNIDPVFRRISYIEAMTKYGSDKPDLRIQNEVRGIHDTAGLRLKLT
jgi:aspartyl-tRNA synthetase